MMKKEQILIIKMTAIGDTVIAIPHIEVISSYHHQADVWLLTAPQSKDIYESHPHLNVTILDRRHRWGPDGFWRKLLWIRRQKFDRIYDLQGNRISRLLTYYGGSPIRIGTNPRREYTHAPSEYCEPICGKNVFERLNETISSAGLPEAEKKANIYLDTDDVLKIEEFKTKWQLTDKRYVVIHAGCSSDHPAKKWPVDHYLILAQLIESRRLKCVWVGTEAERETNAYLSNKVGIDSTCAFTLRQLFGFAGDALFGLGNDSCPIHIFAAAGIPVYCFFGPAYWRWSYPLAQKDRVLRYDVECSPCFRRICPSEKHHACLENILPEDVFTRIDEEILTKKVV